MRPRPLPLPIVGVVCLATTALWTRSLRAESIQVKVVNHTGGQVNKVVKHTGDLVNADEEFRASNLHGREARYDEGDRVAYIVGFDGQWALGENGKRVPYDPDPKGTRYKPHDLEVELYSPEGEALNFISCENSGSGAPLINNPPVEFPNVSPGTYLVVAYSFGQVEEPFDSGWLDEEPDVGKQGYYAGHVGASEKGVFEVIQAKVETDVQAQPGHQQLMYRASGTRRYNYIFCSSTYTTVSPGESPDKALIVLWNDPGECQAGMPPSDVVEKLSQQLAVAPLKHTINTALKQDLRSNWLAGSALAQSAIRGQLANVVSVGLATTMTEVLFGLLDDPGQVLTADFAVKAGSRVIAKSVLAAYGIAGGPAGMLATYFLVDIVPQAIVRWIAGTYVCLLDESDDLFVCPIGGDPSAGTVQLKVRNGGATIYDAVVSEVSFGAKGGMATFPRSNKVDVLKLNEEGSFVVQAKSLDDVFAPFQRYGTNYCLSYVTRPGGPASQCSFAPLLSKMRRYEEPKPPPETDQGLLDVVFAIDTTGSMTDDIQAVQQACDEIINQLMTHCSQGNVSLQIGLVTYQDHADAQTFAGRPEAAWLCAWPLTSNHETIRSDIMGIRITNEAVGGDIEEDLHAALMCAMDARGNWQGDSVTMGWRPGAAKIILPMSDAPAHDPDFEGRTLVDVKQRAAALDPAHIYPLILRKHGLDFLVPTDRTMERLAAATNGRVVRVSSADKLPAALVATVKLAMRRHRNEVWRKVHPPYGLYAAMGVALLCAFLAPLGLTLYMRSRPGRPRPSPSAAPLLDVRPRSRYPKGLPGGKDKEDA